MRRPQVLPLPGNNTRLGTFYDEQPSPTPPSVEWPGSFELDASISQGGHEAPRPDPSPFKLGGM